MTLLNPKTEPFAHLDPKSREIMKKTITYFESRGKEKFFSEALRALRKGFERINKGGERILGDGHFVETVLNETQEKLERK